MNRRLETVANALFAAAILVAFGNFWLVLSYLKLWSVKTGL